jgi:cytochrome c-type biogenesis protein CcmF
MEYLGEHLLPGQIGHFFALLSLVASLVATVAYFKANQHPLFNEKKSWLRIARISFLIETVSVIALFLSLYHIISNHLFEYKYAWQHSSRALPMQYLLSCFWEGQEGSFMLWSFWHCVIGWVIIRKEKQWEPGVMMVISFAQFCIATMLIGLYIFGTKIGSSPFVLMRNESLLSQANFPVGYGTNGLLRTDYMNFIKDGSGLNTLLQNYWMVIHPPILFLGFASTIVPFAFAFAGLVNKEHTWTKPVLPWTAFSAAILGLGIMMGAAWAYESLTFGGYWAWDPVENASLVPWLVMIAGLHTNLIYKSSNYSLKSTYLFYILSFSLILYSTFLTRSGILGDTSVHAFTGADMTTQLVTFLFIFLLPALFLFFRNRKHIPSIKKEENTYSREFWMFIGSLVFFLSAIIITAKTSIPVFNKIFGTKMAPPEDPEFSHNQVQVFIALIIGLLTAVTQYFKYKDTPTAVFRKKIFIPTIIALALSILVSWFGDVNYIKQGAGFQVAIHLALFAAIYSVVANAGYIWIGLKGKLKAAGSSVAHIGFGLVLVGILISSAKKTVLSWNTTGISTLDQDGKEKPAENITLFKGLRTDMGKYHVTYVKDTINAKDQKKHFALLFEEKNSKEQFTLYPDVIKNNKGQEGFAANPDAKHYLNKDIFVYVTSWREGNVEDTTKFQPLVMKAGDTSFYSNGFLILDKVEVNPQQTKHKINPGETVMIMDVSVVTKDGRRYGATPGIAIRGNEVRYLIDTVVSQSLVLKFNKLADEKKGLLELGMKESKAMSDLLTLKVYEFPFINVLWIGVIVMITGLVMSIFQRLRKPKMAVVRKSSGAEVTV